MSNIQGVVSKVWESTGKGPGGVSTYSIVVGGVKYSTYTNKPSCKEGDTVSFEAKQNGAFWNANLKTLKKVASVEAAAAPSTAPVPASSYGKPSAVQDAINYQAARNSAIATVAVLLEGGLIDIGTTKKANKIDTVLTYIDQLTMRFFQDTKDLGHKTKEETAPATEADGFVEDFAGEELPF